MSAGRQQIVVTVDDKMCMGVQSCIRVAPASFVIERGIIARGAAEPGDELAVLLEAAASCPNFAITVVADGEVVFDPDLQ